jgi:hypothetical protein
MQYFADLPSRVVWAIVYTLFLSFGLTIGQQIYDAFGPPQLEATEVSTSGSMLASTTIEGSFSSNSSSWDQVFNNGKSLGMGRGGVRAASWQCGESCGVKRPASGPATDMLAGTFTFQNGSSSATSSTVACYRNPEWTYWWYTERESTCLFACQMASRCQPSPSSSAHLVQPVLTTQPTTTGSSCSSPSLPTRSPSGSKRIGAVVISSSWSLWPLQATP